MSPELSKVNSSPGTGAPRPLASTSTPTALTAPPFETASTLIDPLFVTVVVFAPEYSMIPTALAELAVPLPLAAATTVRLPELSMVPVSVPVPAVPDTHMPIADARAEVGAVAAALTEKSPLFVMLSPTEATSSNR